MNSIRLQRFNPEYHKKSAKNEPIPINIHTWMQVFGPFVLSLT